MHLTTKVTVIFLAGLMVYKKTKLVVLLLTIVALISCGSNADTSLVKGSHTKEIIDYNVKLLSDYKAQGNTSANYQSAANFINQVKARHCDKKIDIATIRTALSVIGTFSYDKKENIKTTTSTLACISKNPLYQSNKDDLYLALVNLILPTGSDISAFKLTYEKLFSQYIPKNKQMLGLIEYSMLLCNTPVVVYLEHRHYPKNTQQLNDGDYALLKSSLDNICLR